MSATFSDRAFELQQQGVDPDAIRRRWAVHPDAGVGMRPHSRLVRGDADHNDAASYTPADTVRGHPDTTRIESLGWRPRYSVAEALERTYRSLTP